jgi:hypothetical protein
MTTGRINQVTTFKAPRRGPSAKTTVCKLSPVHSFQNAPQHSKRSTKVQAIRLPPLPNQLQQPPRPTTAKLYGHGIRRSARAAQLKNRPKAACKGQLRIGFSHKQVYSSKHRPKQTKGTDGQMASKSKTQPRSRVNSKPGSGTNSVTTKSIKMADVSMHIHARFWRMPA